MRSLAPVRRLALLLALLALLALTPSGRADVLAYVTGGNTIYVWDTTTNRVTPVTNSVNGGSLDSLILDNNGNIFYSIIGNSSQIGQYNLNTHSNTLLTSAAGPGVADMALEPGLTTFLVSNAFGTTISRVTISTGAVSNLSEGLRPDGLAYDNNGHLFAVLGLTEVAQLNPTTGAILKTISTPNQPDGLTFDPDTGKLYVSSDGGGFYTLPTDLSGATFTSVPGSPVFDGIASAGNLLYFVVRGQGGLVYNLNTGLITEVSPTIGGADDIAPVAGLGSGVPPPTTPAAAVPEPSGLVLLGAGLAVLAMRAVRRKAAASGHPPRPRET
jgi:DNA-binding beta-propeller fold protein YncE